MHNKIVYSLLTLITLSIFAAAYSTLKIASDSPVYNEDTGLTYTRIQEAIDASETLDGHTISVKAGTYGESLSIHKSLIIIGHDQNETIVNAQSDVGIRIGAEDVKISKLTVQNAGVGVRTNYTGTGVNEVLVRRCNQCGISIMEGATNCKVSRTIVTDVAKSALATGINVGENVSLEENTVTNCTLGIWIAADYCRLTGNDMRNNTYNLFITTWNGTNAIDPSNTVDGKPVYCLVNKRDQVISGPNVGFVGLVDCTNITMRDLNLTKNGQGIYIANSTYCEISSSFIAQNYYGIQILNSSTVIYENRFSSNMYGVDINSPGRFSKVFHNIFLNNSESAEGSHAEWDDGYPSGGNYWSDYLQKYPSATDFKTGPDQEILGSDGIWDAPYYLGESGAQDRYPLVYHPGTTARFNVPGGQKNYTVYVFADSIITAFNFNGSAQEIVFKTTGGTFCNVTVPRNLIDGAFAVRVDDKLVSTELSWSETLISVCFNVTGTFPIRLTAEYIGARATTEFPDITGPEGVPDGVINIIDIALLASHFGEKR